MSRWAEPCGGGGGGQRETCQRGQRQQHVTEMTVSVITPDRGFPVVTNPRRDPGSQPVPVFSRPRSAHGNLRRTLRWDPGLEPPGPEPPGLEPPGPASLLCSSFPGNRSSNHNSQSFSALFFLNNAEIKPLVEVPRLCRTEVRLRLPHCFRGGLDSPSFLVYLFSLLFGNPVFNLAL